MNLTKIVDIRRKQEKLIGIRAKGRRYSYPSCQFIFQPTALLAVANLSLDF
jgi:hypothetical protein